MIMSLVTREMEKYSIMRYSIDPYGFPIPAATSDLSLNGRKHPKCITVHCCDWKSEAGLSGPKSKWAAGREATGRCFLPFQPQGLSSHIPALTASAAIFQAGSSGSRPSDTVVWLVPFSHHIFLRPRPGIPLLKSCVGPAG